MKSIEQRVKDIEQFLDNHFNYNLWNIETKENPRPVKATGEKCSSCYPGKPGKMLVDCEGLAGFIDCPGCTRA